MCDAARFVVGAIPRCSHVSGNIAVGYCGAPAAFGELADNGLALRFSCAHHRGLFAQPLPAEFLYRRVAVTTLVYLAGVSPEPAVAELEARARVATLLGSAGAVVGLQTANSAIGRSSTVCTAPGAIFSPAAGNGGGWGVDRPACPKR
jgi:hypothetical protein